MIVTEMPLNDTKVCNGFTLLEVLLVVSLLSMLALIYGHGKPAYVGERAAALTVARTHALLDALYDNYGGQGASNGWVSNCNREEIFDDLLSAGSLKNGFNNDYHLNSVGCTERYITLYQMVPSIWAGYIINHLEATSLADVSGGLASSFPNYDADRINGYEVIQTRLDIYGNLINGVRFVQQDIVYSDVSNPGQSPSWSAVDSGHSSWARIEKPECAGARPILTYRVSGVCSHFPQRDPHDVAELIDDGYATEDDRYRTFGFHHRLSGACADSDCDRNQPWVIRVTTGERWRESYVAGVDPDTGDDITQYRTVTAEGRSLIECSNSGDTDPVEVDSIKKLIKHLNITGSRKVRQLLDLVGVSYSPNAGYYTINGEGYWWWEIQDMSLEEFESEFLVDLEGILGSDYPNEDVPVLKLNAWVSCET